MDLKEIIAILHPLERRILSSLKKTNSFEVVIKDSGLKEAEVMRAFQWLENKKLLKINKQVIEFIILDSNGRDYAKKGLPETRFLKALSTDPMGVNEVSKAANLDKSEINICIGTLRKKSAINIDKKAGLSFTITKAGKTLASKESLEEKFLKKQFPIIKKLLSQEDQFVFNNLMKRKNILKVQDQKAITVALTILGKKLLKLNIPSAGVTDRLTPAMLKQGTWKNKKLRHYDVSINVPKIYPGRRHFVNEAKQHAKQIWLDIGFKEMTGPIINTSFWNFDALFVPQDHPAREMQDTFFMKENGSLPKRFVSKVKKSHEDSWKYNWSEVEAKKLVLRTHTTVLSARTIAALKKSDIPAKFFSVGRNYRNEAVDWSHLFEFNQTEGIVVDLDANFKHLLGYLKEFFQKMGYEKIKFRPAYFPYTEPSVEIDIYIPERKTWVELGGAGIFRPEVIIPLLGKDIPVLAWGPGFDRPLTQNYDIKDIRDLYKNDLKQLKEIKTWI